MPGSEEYYVGWICAIVTEYVAAQAFLDEKYDGPEQVAANDNNDYTLGRIGRHNVVLAVLPDGEYGTSSATGVARDMLHTFPNIRIGLMVGIGGGVPSTKHDIRLGDVVVSAVRNGQGGVLQYDFGTTVQNQRFKLSGLKAQYEGEGHEIDATIKNILDKKKRLKKRYQRPTSESDRLYQSDSTHFAHGTACHDGCDSTKLVARHERLEDEDSPSIHYGLIASGNQLMRDAMMRDTLGKETDVLCFEMEAAGLMNQFACLVVRGICDYSDTHENDKWRGYAAMTAAAYAKDLLKRIPPNKVEVETRIIDVLSSVERSMNEAHREIKHLVTSQEEEKLTRWLNPSDPSNNYNLALGKRQNGTGRWLLESEKFLTWKNSRQNSFLWLHGIPGCGKTILSTTVIQNLITTPNQPTLYYYFSFSDPGKQSLENMIRSLLIQLSVFNTTVRKPLANLYSICNRGYRQQPNLDALCNAFQDMVLNTEELWIVLDALDECQTRKALLSWVTELLKTESSNVHLLVTSRPEQDILSQLSELPFEEDIIPLQSEIISDDICAFIQHRVRTENGLKRWRKQPEVQTEIEMTLSEKAHGMFRWVVCQLDVLEQCLDYQSLTKALTSLPMTLDETYSRVLDTVTSTSRDTTIRILQLLTFTERPLMVPEVVDAIAVNLSAEGKPFKAKNRMPEPSEITQFCPSLIVIVPHKTGEEKVEELQLAHFSVKEYLMSERLNDNMRQYFQKQNAFPALARVCVAYLLSIKHGTNELEPVQMTRKDSFWPSGRGPGIRKQFPFAKYSSSMLMVYAKDIEEKDNELRHLIEQLFCFQEAPYAVFDELRREDEPHSSSAWPAISHAAAGGLKDTINLLIQNGIDVDTEGGYYGNALQVALVKNQPEVVKLLLDKGSNVNAQGGFWGTALQAASSQGHSEAVKLLIERGANVNAQGGHWGNALQAALHERHIEVVKLLVENGADINAEDVWPNTALQTACLYPGNENIVRYLIDHGAVINAQGGYYGNALQAALHKGDQGVVKLLIEKGANVDVQGGFYGNALQVASYKGDMETVKRLIREGADVNAQGGLYGSPLEAALHYCNDDVVKVLVENGANVNIQERYLQDRLRKVLSRNEISTSEYSESWLQINSRMPQAADIRRTTTSPLSEEDMLKERALGSKLAG